MEKLTTNITDATGLEPTIAKAAVGHVLWFLRSEAPQGHVAEFIEKMPDARIAVDAAAATGDGGLSGAIEGLTSFMGTGRWDTNILVRRLLNVGVKPDQIQPLIEQVLGRAETLVGPEGAAKIRSLLPAIDVRLAETKAEAMRRSA